MSSQLTPRTQHLQLLDDAAVNGALAAVTGSDNSDVRRQRTLDRSVAAAR